MKRISENMWEIAEGVIINVKQFTTEMLETLGVLRYINKYKDKDK